MGLPRRDSEHDKKLLRNDTIRTFGAPVAVVLPIIVTLVVASWEASRQAELSRVQLTQQAELSRDQLSAEAALSRAQLRSQENTAITAEVVSAMLAPQTCERAILKAAVATRALGPYLLPRLASGIQILVLTSSEPSQRCSVERFTKLASPCLGLVPTIKVGTPGDDIINGTPGNDVINGGGGNDDIAGGDGNDVICGDDGDDQIGGGAGNDRLSGGLGIDGMTGDDGIDVLLGDRGGDDLSGDEDGDQLYGGDGNDIMSGGDGSDVCSGGAGRDSASSCELASLIP